MRLAEEEGLNQLGNQLKPGPSGILSFSLGLSLEQFAPEDH